MDPRDDLALARPVVALVSLALLLLVVLGAVFTAAVAAGTIAYAKMDWQRAISFFLATAGALIAIAVLLAAR